MRVPQSPKSLRRVMTVSSVRSEDDDGATSNSSGDETSTRSTNAFKKSKPNESATRPPRPTYTSKVKDGKFTFSMESSQFGGMEEALMKNNDNNNNVSDDSVKNANDAAAADAKKLLDGAALPASFHRSRERTRISAVQRLVERKLAQKERERLREREQESSSCNSRERSWEATYRSSFGGRSFSASGHCKVEEQQQQQKPRTAKENEYLASLLYRTSRSCSGTRRRVPQSDGEEEVAKTIITIGPGKPTRIREHSPSKRSPTSELPPSSFNIEEEEDEGVDRPTPLKSDPRDQSPSKKPKSESLYKNSTPLKSTGLFREFAKTTTTKTTSDGKRKTSFTTEKTFQVNVDDKEKTRRLSIDCNYVYERSAPTFSTFSQSEDNNRRPTISSSTSSLTSSFSSTSSGGEDAKEPIRLSRLRPATFATSPQNEKGTEAAPEPPIRERKTSRRIFISTAFNTKNDSGADDTSSTVSSSSSDDSATVGNDEVGNNPFSSASSRLLFNLSSGYRYHRMAAAANSTLNNNINNSNSSSSHNKNLNGPTRHININISNKSNDEVGNNTLSSASSRLKSYNSNDDSYPRRRFSQEHLAQEDKDSFSGESVFVSRPVRQPIRKISLPVRPAREQRRDAPRWDDSALFQAMSGDGESTDYGGGGGCSNKCGGPTRSSSSGLLLQSWSKYKLCDDSLFYPGCCVEHDRLSLVEKGSSLKSSSSSSGTNNFPTNKEIFYDFGDGVESSISKSNLHDYNNSDTFSCKDHFEASSVVCSSDVKAACLDLTDDASSHSCSDSCSDLDENSKTFETNLQKNCGSNCTKDDDDHDVSKDDFSLTSELSCSGIDFFRKLVIHRDRSSPAEIHRDRFVDDNDDSRSSKASTIKGEINLIDRFISDTLQVNSNNLTAESCSDITYQEWEEGLSLTASTDCQTTEGALPEDTEEEDVDSLTDVRSVSKESSVTGSGLLYLKNYLRKKKKSSSRSSEAEISRPSSSLSDGSSTLADILNETFDSEDSELEKLDWDEFEDEVDDLSFDDDPSLTSTCELESFLSNLQTYDNFKAVAHNLNPTPNFASAQKVVAKSHHSKMDESTTKCGLRISVDSPLEKEAISSSSGSSGSGNGNGSTAKNSPSIQTLNPPEPLEFGGMERLRSQNLSGKERADLIRSMKENEPVKNLILSSPTTFKPNMNKNKKHDSEQKIETTFFSCRNQVQNSLEVIDKTPKEDGPKNRLANFWEKRILQSGITVDDVTGGSILRTSFRPPAVPSYYSPEGAAAAQSTANDKIQKFLEATRQAAEKFETKTSFSTSISSF